VPKRAVIEEIPKARAVTKYIRVGPRKARQVVDLIRGKPVEEALTILQFCPKAAAKIVSKVVNSAVANAERNLHLRRVNLYISEAYVDQGPTLKRYRPRAMGRVAVIRRKTSHITIVVQEREEVPRRGAKG